MKKPRNKLTKKELRGLDRLTRPPRMEGKAKSVGSRPMRKKKGARAKKRRRV